MEILRQTGEKQNLTPSQMKKEIEKLDRQIEILLAGCYCPMCDKHKSKDKFYKSTNPDILSGVSFICKDCAKNIALRRDADGNYHDPTKESVMQALEYIDKPFLDSLWDTSYFESHGENKSKDNIWSAYIKNVSMKQYDALRWKDGDNFKNQRYAMAVASGTANRTIQNEEHDEFDKNRKDVIKLVGYDPFDNYPREDDKPYLYASLVAMIDDDTKDDGMKMRAVIQIVQAHNQIRRLNDAVNMLIANPDTIFTDLAQINKAQSTINGLIQSANALAKDNGISVNFNNNKSKGANTLSGKIKELSEKNFEGADINAFDIETCKGMMQVAELSEKARHEQIGFDDNIAQEIKDIKVELVESLTKERDAALETMRKLLDENNKIKEFLREKNLINDQMQVIYC